MQYEMTFQDSSFLLHYAVTTAQQVSVFQRTHLQHQQTITLECLRAPLSSKTFRLMYQYTWSTIPEHSNLQQYNYENLKMMLLTCILILSTLLMLSPGV